MDSEQLSPASTFEVVESDAGKIYRLPKRPIGPLRWIAIAPMLAAFATGVFFVYFFLARVANWQFNEITWLILTLIGLLWARGAYSLISFAAVIWCGRTEIEILTDGSVRAVDRVGWFRVRWGKLKPNSARQILLSEFIPTCNADGQPITLQTPLWLLSTTNERGDKAWLAPGHPRDVLAPLAEILAKELALTIPAEAYDSFGDTRSAPQAFDLPSNPLPVVVEETELAMRDVLEQPAGSRAQFEQHPDGVTITIPPIGIRRAYGGILLFALIFATVGAVVTIGTAAPLFRANPQLPSGAIIVGFIFFCVGTGLVIGAIHAGRKQVVLAVVGDQLLTFETGPLGSRRREFSRGDLHDIACSPSDVSVNDRQLPQLQIVPKDSKQHGMLTGHDERELMWIATMIRRAIGIPATRGE